MVISLIKIHKQILKEFEKIGVGNPLTISDLRQRLHLKVSEQDSLTRRMRNLREFGYDVVYDHHYKGYILKSLVPTNCKSDNQPISGRLRAEVLYSAQGRCQMCGKNISEDKIKLVVDHRIPRSWGGITKRENLWALCENCNISKKNFFATIDNQLLRRSLAYDEPIRGLAELLVGYKGKPVPRRLLELVGQGEQWTRRIRELRELGWKVTLVRMKGEKRRYSYTYRLAKGERLPDDIPTVLRQYRKTRTKKQ
jgi:hypothetical protein